MGLVAQIRDTALAALPADRKTEFEQYLTPESVASQAVSLFTPTPFPVRILDFGAGTGILGAETAIYSPSGSSVTAVELDRQLAALAGQTLDHVGVEHEVLCEDALSVTLDPVFDRVILNPPYKKIAPVSLATESGYVPVSNLYTAFLVCAISALKPGGECVAIIPRSWMNGEYFAAFRTWLFGVCSIDVMAVYGSRQDHFRDSNVLQEIMLLKLSKRAQGSLVMVYDGISPSDDLQTVEHVEASLNDLLVGGSRILRVRRQSSRLAGLPTLAESGLWVSTGKLVWFRNRDILLSEPEEDSLPLYWSDNTAQLEAEHPVSGSRREQWVSNNAYERHVVLPVGSYCLVNRFSSKEQRHRVMPSLLTSTVPFVADNKLNYVHQGTSRNTIPLDTELAAGLTLWLASSLVDDWYRQVSGSTQVNATDLRELPTPSKKTLTRIAQKLPLNAKPSQENIDHVISQILEENS
ncbi:methyltransferase [Bifidobacterium crudilactis]|uniref:methyltransferase n=1 Tax=Bifidobacterium crudilactis TaxID=327277 RepID=UPI002648A1D9|nr:methyltransferase [Bifidobacterium crudilactis]MDN5973071.1 methyltransferase [Bifidobacterium crudilactis]MDN6000288.1 methyltransferase [Bifidobacterium crudilactis]MDN6208997.1 methyltransferase [Bifidobacterium crudilactis]MDN6467903.1 methyltransferase [Bifidobacterium crudilactis]MDN6558657.1 methyltransferase [Bifidobacterium crudilactis]